MLVKLDKEDFVISVEREMTEAKTAICKGPYHNRSGKGTSLPIEQFPTNRYHPDKRTKLCERCIAPRRNPIPEEIKLSKIVETRIPISPGEKFAQELRDVNLQLEDGGMQYKWRVVFLNEVECVVYAKNYINAGKQVQGRVVSVEQLD